MSVKLVFSPVDGVEITLTAENLEDAWTQYQAFTNSLVGEHVFDVDQIVPAVLDGKVYWKARGGKFSKYGVSLWEEVAALSGLNLDSLDSVAGYFPPPGTQAEYITTTDDNGKEKPKKVVRLIFPEGAPELAPDKTAFFAAIGDEIGITDKGVLVNILKDAGISGYNDSLRARMASVLRQKLGGRK